MPITTDERVAQWLCESIEDTIKRYQEALKSDTEWVANDETSLEKERQRDRAPIPGVSSMTEFYEKSVSDGRARLNSEKEAIDSLLTLFKEARELQDKVKRFWENQTKRFVEEAAQMEAKKES